MLLATLNQYSPRGCYAILLCFFLAVEVTAYGLHFCWLTTEKWVRGWLSSRAALALRPLERHSTPLQHKRTPGIETLTSLLLAPCSYI
jgi:hypothetical protein